METGAEAEFTASAGAGDLARVQGLVGRVSNVEKEEALRKAAGNGRLAVVRYHGAVRR